jgi:hypothetical protein
MKHLRLLFTFSMVFLLALAAITPAFAEDAPPPPSINPDGSTGSGISKAAEQTAQSTDNPDSEISTTPPASEAAGESPANQPNYSPEGAATSGMGVFNGEQLISSGGNPVKEGTDLGVLSSGWAYYCAPGKFPDFLPGGTCTTRATLLNNAINSALSGWTIWATAWFMDYTTITVNKPLTIQGDPSGLMMVGDAATHMSGVIINAPNVTLRDLYSYGMISWTDQPGTLRLQNINIYASGFYALGLADSFGSVIIGNLSVENSKYGSIIDTRNGAGTVTILNSTFDNTQTWNGDPHSGNGLYIRSNNKVTLENVSASGNWNDGLNIEYQKGLTIKNGKFDNNYNSNHTFDPVYDGDVYGFGIHAVDVGTTAGTLLLQNVSATRNGEIGAYFESPGTTTILNSFFNKNIFHGLLVYNGRSSVLLDGVNANRNGATGQPFDGADIAAVGAVSVNSSTFNYNFDDGLYVNTHGGMTIKNTQASYNNQYGLALDNSFATSTAGATVANVIAHQNGQEGLAIATRGNVLVSGLSASYNNWLAGDSAVHIDNCLGNPCTGFGSVTFSNIQGTNSIFNNSSTGLVVLSKGNFTATNLVVEDNLGIGAWINNSRGTGNVTISNSTFNQNGWPYLGGGSTVSGLWVQSAGNISLDKVTALNNTYRGIDLDNTYVPIGSKTISLKNITSNLNWYDGVYLKSKGAVTINHLVSSNNGEYGLYLDNSYGTTGGVTISSTLGNNLVSYNSYGIVVYSKGTVSINGLEATNTGPFSTGLVIYSSTLTGSVSISNIKVNDGGAGGIVISSRNNITLNNVEASGNLGGYGAFLSNYLAGSGKSITINKSIFNKNGSYGVLAEAGGTITFNGVNASNNANDGAVIDNYFVIPGFTFSANVNLLSTLGANLFNNNGGDGVYITTAGNVVVSKVTASYNSNDAFEIFMYGTGKTITMTCSTTSRNLYGIMVSVYGGPVKVYLKGTFPFWNTGTDYSITAGSSIVFSRMNCP